MAANRRSFEHETESGRGIKLMAICTVRRLVSGLLFAFAVVAMPGLFGQVAQAKEDDQTKFRRIPTQFIAALGDPDAVSGSGAQSWGIWRVDPGPRGVRLRKFEALQAAGGVAPAKWQFDKHDWWLEENGLIMEKPDFPVPAGQYIVTGDREAVAVLTVHPADKDGDMRWELSNDAKLYDVTHLPCRSARYTPLKGQSCSPENAPSSEFRVTPGAAMPAVKGCSKQDYAVLFVVAVAVQD